MPAPAKTHLEYEAEEMCHLMQSIGWPATHVAMRMDTNRFHVMDMQKAKREIPHGWLVYMRAVHAAIARIPLPTGESDEPGVVPDSLRVTALDEHQQANSQAYEIRRAQAKEEARMIAEGRYLEKSTVLAEIVQAYFGSEMEGDELQGARMVLMSLASKLGLEDGFMAAVSDMAASASGAEDGEEDGGLEVVVGGRAPGGSLFV